MVALDPSHTVEDNDAPDKVGNGFTLNVTFVAKLPLQFGLALVNVIPVICNISPLFAYVNDGVVKLPAPDEFDVTPVSEYGVPSIV